jgi:hypothetical protein
MKTTDEQIEKMAREYAEKYTLDGYIWINDEWTTDIFQEMGDAYKAGFKACEAKMLAEVANAPVASEGFEEWRKNYISTHTGYFKMIGTDDLADIAFTAGAMSQAKEIQKLKADREVMTKALKNINKSTCYGLGCDAVAEKALKAIGEISTD